MCVHICMQVCRFELIEANGYVCLLCIDMVVDRCCAVCDKVIHRVTV